jgi:carotenoid cleavage dioxygenase-like enzyme
VLLAAKIWHTFKGLRTYEPQKELPTAAIPHSTHPYLSGNFAPVRTELPLTPCSVIGTLPAELAGGQYIRNGGNPLFDNDVASDQESHFHWFDGDGMLSGVYFPRTADGELLPHFVNAYVLSDVHVHARSTPALKKPFIPSIALFSDPLATSASVIMGVMRGVMLVLASNLPGAKQILRKLSVANTSILYHDGRALVTCESGPPMRVQLPSLETVGWFDGARAEGEPEFSTESELEAFGEDDPVLGWMKAWTTAHPRVDPYTNELILYHSMILPPYIHYSVLPACNSPETAKRLVSVPVRGLPAPKLSHDFACTLTQTILLDLPLHLNPLHIASTNPQPMVLYDPAGYARFGIFPRHDPSSVRWIEDREGGACCVFHTAAAWDELEFTPSSSAIPGNSGIEAKVVGASVLGCRLNSASLVYSAGNLPAPPHSLPRGGEEEACELFYWRLSNLSGPSDASAPEEAFSLSAIPFEFPATPRASGMGWPAALGGGPPRYVWGCTLRDGCFGAGLGRTATVDALAKLDIRALIAAGCQRSHMFGSGDRSAVDKRTVDEIVRTQECGETRDDDPIKIFALPPGWAAQEPTFVPRMHAQSEDDGYLLTYVFDEAQLDGHGNAPPHARSELWVIDATNMQDVVARVVLPQRVPYGLHGDWFAENELLHQRPVQSVRNVSEAIEDDTWIGRLRRFIERAVG